MSRAALCCILLLVLARPVAAEWHIVPMFGLTTLGSTSIVDAEEATGKRHWNLGGAVSFLGSGLLGAEVVTFWTPGFFDRDEVGGEPDFVKSSRTVSLMGNIVVTAPQRWTEYGLRPFVSGGFGLMHVSKTDIPENILPRVDLNLLGYNVGGGAVGFFTQRTGVRFDVRYHSVLNPSDHGLIAFGDVRMRYVTATVGIVFRR
jgi:hypothetical protein